LSVLFGNLFDLGAGVDLFDLSGGGNLFGQEVSPLLAVTRTPLVGAPVTYEAAEDTDAARGAALADALDEFVDGDVYELVVEGIYELPDVSDPVVSIEDKSFTLRGQGSNTIIKSAVSQRIIIFDGDCQVLLEDFNIDTAFTAFAIGNVNFSGSCVASRVNSVQGEGINPVAGTGSLRWADSFCNSATAFASDPTGLTTTLHNWSSTALEACLDIGSVATDTIVRLTGNCVLESTGAGQHAIAVNNDGSYLYAFSGSVTSDAAGIDINNGGGFVCVGPHFDYDPLKTIGVISECAGGGSPSGALGGAISGGLSAGLAATDSRLIVLDF
jgi:hypothetical protein